MDGMPLAPLGRMPHIKGGAAMNARLEPVGRVDEEYDDIVQLLLEHSARADTDAERLCHVIAMAAMGENHLWQDMGCASRKELSALMREHFPALVAKNVGDMKWKKFFYRQLCERAEVPICKSPHCAACCDHHLCFGPEEA
jgi:nitrogen fixation protein NifQ